MVKCLLQRDELVLAQPGGGEAINALPITRHSFHGDWNYTFHPAHHRPMAHAGITNAPSAAGPHRLTLQALRHPELTGMPRATQ
ncbi:hypothetical protein [Streptomyces sp. NL15-2K]|uniref:hypothetical protein n=1 Tax=Streptomyces sp. NL15-2K TaxID=376149 RepID=UPI000F586A9D|nr:MULTISPECIES: hypothetical protein [Actinomycetes]WKX10770.1 hypothetical protein Q4V64_26010 [Kutzneria buriramensis]GCB47680.1 hypothetical protein SNL152K_4986 [Streptomyces sp. NL15-2K]